MMLSRKVLLTVTLTSVAASVVSLPSLASAAPTPAAVVRPTSLSMCDGGELCLWANTNYGGDEAAIPANYNVANLSSFGMYKRASSLYNKTNYAAEIYASPSYKSGPFGSQICVESGEVMSDLSKFISFSFNDKAVSVKWIGRKCPA